MKINTRTFLIFCTSVAGLCSLMYELLIGTVSSFFLGDSVLQFSLTIGIYLAAMGVGSFFARFVSAKPTFAFVFIELLLGLIGGLSVPILYFLFTIVPISNFNYVVFSLVTLIGVLTGFEVPLLTILLEKAKQTKNNLSDVLAFDYLGALISTFTYPFFFLPILGTFKTSLIFGSINLFVGLLTAMVLEADLKREKSWPFKYLFWGVLALNIVCLSASSYLMTQWKASLFANPVIFNKHSNYQDITITNHDEDVSLYLNSVIQFNSKDEYRYHESLVHVPLLALKNPKKVLILGGGEGLASREVLKHKSIEKVDLVELDPEIIELSSDMQPIKRLNKASLSDPRTNVIIQDAFTFLSESTEKYDLIIADLPDPNSETLARLYTDFFYQYAIRRLRPNGLFVTQATNPSLNPNTFWCIAKTLSSVGFKDVIPYKTYVPSFGEWGFIVASPSQKIQFRNTFLPDLKYLSEAHLPALFNLPKDVLSYKGKQEVNTLDKLPILEYYLDELRNLVKVETKQ